MRERCARDVCVCKRERDPFIPLFLYVESLALLRRCSSEAAVAGAVRRKERVLVGEAACMCA